MGAACGLCRWGSARSPRGWRGVVSPSSACFKFTVEPVAKFDFPAFNFMLFHALVFAYLVRALFAADLCCNGCEGLWNGLRVHGGGGGAVGGDGGEEKGSKSHYFFFVIIILGDGLPFKAPQIRRPFGKARQIYKFISTEPSSCPT